MSFALCRSEATKAAGIIYYFKAFATKEMLEAKPNNIHFKEFQLLKNDGNHLIISETEQIKQYCGECGEQCGIGIYCVAISSAKS